MFVWMSFTILLKNIAILVKKQPTFNISNTPRMTPKNRMHADWSILYQNAILILWELISHQNKENKKKMLKSLDK